MLNGQHVLFRTQAHGTVMAWLAVHQLLAVNWGICAFLDDANVHDPEVLYSELINGSFQGLAHRKCIVDRDRERSADSRKGHGFTCASVSRFAESEQVTSVSTLQWDQRACG